MTQRSVVITRVNSSMVPFTIGTIVHVALFTMTCFWSMVSSIRSTTTVSVASWFPWLSRNSLNRCMIQRSVIVTCVNACSRSARGKGSLVFDSVPSPVSAGTSGDKWNRQAKTVRIRLREWCDEVGPSKRRAARRTGSTDDGTSRRTPMWISSRHFELVPRRARIYPGSPIQPTVTLTSCSPRKIDPQQGLTPPAPCRSSKSSGDSPGIRVSLAWLDFSF